MNNNVKVHNLNVYPFTQKFRGDMVTIPANDYIEMDYDDAVLFIGQYSQIILDKGGIQRPESYKMLKIDEDDKIRIYNHRHGKNSEEKTKFVCHVCTKEFLTKKGLLAHIKGKHSHLMMDDDARDELLDDEEIEADET